MLEEKIKTLQTILDTNKNIVFFTGAGVSTDSGIKDFRSKDGLYQLTNKYPVEEILSHRFFVEHTKEFYSFYKDKMLALDAKPNTVHTFIAQLEQANKSLGVITQNIDGLHQLAGSKKVFELHGSTLRNYCQRCGKFYDVTSVQQAKDIPTCSCSGIIKPDVVLYGEALDEQTLIQSIQTIEQADVLIVLGTSLVVYPAASLLNYFHGKHLVLINKTITPYDHKADLLIQANFNEVFPYLNI